MKDASNTAPKVSIVIPVYNAGDLLRIVLDSILGQTEPSFEVILVDDGSCDDGKTAAIIDGYCARDSRLKIFRQKNKGVMLTRDIGISYARGNFVYVCDQDDYLHPQMLEFCLWACEKYNLDYLKVTHQFGTINATERLHPLGDFDKIHVDVVDNAASDANMIGQTLKKLHTDSWSQFGKQELMKRFPASEYDVSRVFHIVETAARWGVEDVPLYYYHGDIAGSLIHKPIPPRWIAVLHAGWQKVYDLYRNKATDDKGRVKFRSICRHQLTSQMKVILHMIKRQVHLNCFKDRLRVWANFGDMAVDFLFVRRLTVSMTGFRRYVEYLIIALVWGMPHIVFTKIRRLFVGGKCKKA